MIVKVKNIDGYSNLEVYNVFPKALVFGVSPYKPAACIQVIHNVRLFLYGDRSWLNINQRVIRALRCLAWYKTGIADFSRL